MKCIKCKNELPKDAEFCSYCGNKVQEIKAKKNITRLKSKKILFMIILIIVIIISLIFYGKISLKKQLLRGWERIEKGESGSLYSLELNFSDKSIDYNFDGGYLVKSKIKTYNYNIVGYNKIKINNTTYTITFNDEKNMMTITPALTSTDSYENWFNHD